PQAGGTSVINCLRNKTGDVDIRSVEDVHTQLVEAVVGADDELMEKYLNDDLSDDEARAAAAGAVASGDFMPVYFVNSLGDVGIEEIKDALRAYCPCPDIGLKRTFVKGEEESKLDVSADGDFVGQVFKVSTDPKSHIKYVHLRVHSGKLTPDMNIKGGSLTKATRPGHILRMVGASHTEIEAGVAGDIIALAKLDLHIGDTVSVAGEGTIPMPTLPNPMYALALESKSRGDEDKIGAALRRFEEEDPCFVIEHRAGGELVARGMGELQLRTYFTRMATQQKLEVSTKLPRIPYMETISRKVENVEYTHKKQSGGSGEFGRVVINMLPAERGEGYEFVDKIFGGSIDQAYRPSVDKGCRSEMDHGVLAGYPVVDVKVELIDGKTHPVDSKDSAFQKAGKGAFREAFMQAKPVLLEPIVHVEVTVPSENVGDITGDLASRRGRPQGQDVVPGNMTVIQADVPLAELSDYNSRLSSITGGQGSYSMELSHYEQVPSNVQQQIVDAHAKEAEAVAH
ncbi:MAG: elongation factor G, partial [Phycisphaerae bacterium]